MLVISSAFRVKTLKATRAHYIALPSDQKRKLVLQVLGGGLFLTANWFCFIYVTNHISVKAGSFAYLVCPILTTVLAYFILKEHLTRLQWISVLLSVASCTLLAFNDLSDLLFSLATALSYALYLVSQRKDYGVDKFFLLTLQVLFSALLLLPFYPVFSGAIPQSEKFYVLIAVIALFFTILPLLLNLYALKGLRSSTVGILLYINPLVGFIIAVAYYKERLNGVQVIAYGIIACSVVLFNIRPRSK